MPITVNWLDESQDALECVTTDPWTYAEIVQMLDTAEAMIGSRTDAIPFLSDMTHSTTSPRLDIASFKRIAQHPMVRGGRITSTFLGGIGISTRTLMSVASPFFPRLFKTVKSYSSREAALRALRQHQQTDTIPAVL